MFLFLRKQQQLSDGEVVLLQTAKEVHSFQGDYEGKGSYETEGAVWRGELITEGGGFCGARTKVSHAHALYKWFGAVVCDT